MANKDGRAGNGGARAGAGRPKRVFRFDLTDEEIDMLSDVTAYYNRVLNGHKKPAEHLPSDDFTPERLLRTFATMRLEEEFKRLQQITAKEAER